MQHRHCLHAGLVPTDSAGRGAATHLSKYPAEDMEPGPGMGNTVLQETAWLLLPVCCWQKKAGLNFQAVL